MDHLIKSALAAGIVIGLLSGLPFIEFGNCFCCMWVVLGGILGAYLNQSFGRKGTGPGKGLAIGVGAGLLGAVLKVVLSLAFMAAGLSTGDVIGPRLVRLIPEEAMEQHLRKLPPAEQAKQREQLRLIKDGKMPSEIPWEQVPVQAGVTVFMYVLFAGVGGLVGGLLVPALESGSGGQDAPAPRSDERPPETK